MEMMSTDELARILGVSKKEAKSIKASLAKQDQGADAWAEYEKELHGPDTPGLSREASIAASEESLNIDTSGPVPPSKPLPYAPKPAPTPALGPIELDSATLQRYTAALDTIKRVQANNAETLLPQERTKLQGLQDIARCKQTEYDDLVKQTDYAMSKLKMASKGGVMGRWDTLLCTPPLNDASMNVLAVCTYSMHNKTTTHHARTFPQHRLAHGSVFTSPTQQQKDDLKEAAQAEYDECSKKLQASKLVLDDVNADVVAQQKVVDTLQVDVDALNAAKALESQIAATIFEGSAGDAEENALEAAVHAALPALEQARADVANYGAVKEKLQGALQKFEQAEYKWDAGTDGCLLLALLRMSQTAPCVVRGWSWGRRVRNAATHAAQASRRDHSKKRLAQKLAVEKVYGHQGQHGARPRAHLTSTGGACTCQERGTGPARGKERHPRTAQAGASRGARDVVMWHVCGVWL